MSLLLFFSFDSAPRILPAVVISPYEIQMALADRAVLGNLGGASIIYKTATGSQATIKGMFDSEFVLDKGDSEAGVEAQSAQVFLRVEDLPADPEIDEPTLTIGTHDYRVIERKADGVGGIVLVLRLVN